MRTEMLLGGESAFALNGALLIYGDGRQVFATRHEVEKSDVGAPTLGPGQLVSTAFLRELAVGLGASVPAEVLPPQVLVRTAEVTVWWRPASRVPLFFNIAKGMKDAAALMKLSGKLLPQPPLVFRATANSLWVRALPTNERPAATTKLLNAPYYNVSASGAVCLGTMRMPATRSLDSIEQWETSFFASEFTHPLPGVTLTRHPGGFTGYWQAMKKESEWLPALLAAPKKTQLLRDFVTDDSRGSGA